MENNTFKSVTFGGFDKQDVIHYIEQSSQEHASAIEKLQKENDALHAENAALSEQVTGLKTQTEEQTAALEQARDQLSHFQAENAELQPLRRKTDQLASEIALLQPDAEAYRAIKTRIGDMECAARKRAADLESATAARLNKLVSDFRSQYQELASTFDATSGYVTGELRKVEVNLSQLPRALDQIGADLNDLDAVLKDSDKQ